MSQYGKKLTPHRRMKTPRGVKGERKTIVITHNPSTIAAGQNLIIKFPPLGPDDVIVPGSVRLAFKLELEGGSDDNRSIYNNLARNLIREINVRLQGHTIICERESDVFHNFKYNWLDPRTMQNMAYQGIESPNISKLRLGAGDASDGANSGKDKNVADAYGNRYSIPLDIELFNTHHPFYPSGLKSPLTYELTFNDHGKVVKATDDTAEYSISDLALEYEVVTNKELAQTIRTMHTQKVYYFFDRIHTHEVRSVNKSDTLWNVHINQPIRSLKGILMLWKRPSVKNPQQFYNPKISKTTITVEGRPNQLYAQGLKMYQHWHEIVKYFGDSHDTEHGRGVMKDMSLYWLTLEEYLSTNYGLWLDFRSTDDNSLHGTGRKISENGGISIQMTRDAESSGDLTMYVFLIMDAQLTIEDGNFGSLMY